MVNGSQRNGMLLYDSNGYTYTRKLPLPKNGTVTWRCSVRNGYKGGLSCRAKVYQVSIINP